MLKTTSHDGTVIAYERFGQGPALVMVGGAFQVRDDAHWLTLARLLAERFTVVTYDRRGRGDSGDTGPYEVRREVEDIAALVAELGGSALLLGMSSGAVLALEAVQGGVPVTGLAVYEPPFVVEDSRPPLPADYVERLRTAVAEGRRGDAVELFLTAAVGLPAEYLGGMRADAAGWAHMESLAHTLAYDGTVMGATMSGRPLPADRWPAVTVPTLVVDGGASPPMFGHGARALAALLPAAERRTLEGQDHQVDPALLAGAVTEFFG
ncbi:alpha/beta fold hydrolase [Streptomyces sp. WAC06614]|uniref:alpha/beta fold hydrolase n=1 Tax=Streptomyces sp. WAC06614 TaxID=2487416 RepID=UPI000F774E4E|nr:alpha/beta hydrolase [Streptomyces sp. WAC06614]RSS79267.1 alpha/beta hydrolase [Streptomyces sp. WAC06614]